LHRRGQLRRACIPRHHERRQRNRRLVSRQVSRAQLGRDAAAQLAYEEALLLTGNAVERQFLLDRLGSLGGG